jgi:hypothetical protein
MLEVMDHMRCREMFATQSHKKPPGIDEVVIHVITIRKKM